MSKMACCNICAEQFTKMVRKPTTCPYCRFEACRECVERYFLTKTEPSCMNCNKVWSRYTLVRNCSNQFIEGPYKRHRENVLFEIERALMPSTQSRAQHVLQSRKHLAQIRQNMTHIHMIKSDMIIPENNVERKRYNNEVRKRVYALELENQLLEFQCNNMDDVPEEHRVRRDFVHSCPTPNCKGFLSTRWKCSLCDKYTCSDCHCTKEDDHTCNPDTVASIQALKQDKNIKPCPKCGISISKVLGCDQMFCTICNIAFSWKTGELTTGVIHNPHYFEYLRSMGKDTRNMEDIACGGLPQIGYRAHPSVYMIYQRAAEFQQYKLRRYAQYTTMDVNGYTDLRISYMVNDIDEKTFKLKLQQLDKQRQKSIEIGQAMSTYIQIVGDVLRRHQSEKTLYAQECLDELNGAISYVNGILVDISRSYKCVVPYIEIQRITTVKH